MPNTKTTASKQQERQALHSTIWKVANDLRGSVDGWDFKSYILGFLFYRFISENLSIYVNKKEREAGQKDFDYAKISDEKASLAKENIVNEKGFFILPSQIFENIHRSAAKDDNLNETLSKVFQNIEASAQGNDSERNFKGLFDDIDTNSNKLGQTVQKRNEKLVKIINAIADLKLGDYFDNTIDILATLMSI
jgi:type I restriction enzyme M protein